MKEANQIYKEMSIGDKLVSFNGADAENMDIDNLVEGTF